jgi:hypothetical protein
VAQQANLGHRTAAKTSDRLLQFVDSLQQGNALIERKSGTLLSFGRIVAYPDRAAFLGITSG